MKLSKLIPGKKLLLRVYFWVKRQQRISEQRLLSIRLRSIASELRAELPTTLPDGRPWPRISIVTPSFNQGAYIAETIESVIRQEYPNVEHIIIDGGSTDKTLEVVERYRNHLTCFVSEPDKGQSDAINKGFSRATGDILCWLNSDDQLAPGALAAVAMAFATSQADMVSGICELYTDGQLVHRHMTSCADGPLPLADLLDLDNGWNAGQFFYQPEVFFSRALWEKTGAHVKADYYYSMDYELWCRFALAGAKLHVVGAPLARFRIHPDQKTADPSKFKNELVKVRNEFVTAHKIQAQPVTRPAARFDRTLRIAMVNDNGRRYGAGIAQARIADSIEMAGHAVKFFDLVSWTEENAQAGEKEFIEAIVQFSPDLVIFGNLHTANRESVTVIDALSSKFPSFWVTHDFWLFTGRCAYPAECTKYLTGCNASCPTPNQYPDLAPDKIANAWQTKHAFLAGDHVPYFLANSEWSGEFVKSIMTSVGGNSKQYVGQLKLGVPTDVFRPLQKYQIRNALNIDQKGFVIAYSVSSLSEERKGSRYLVEALRSLDQTDISVILIGNLDIPFDVPNVKQVSLGYVTDPKVLNAALTAADVYVAPSTMETFGQVFVEAALAGIPSIGFDQTGVRDAIVEGVTGFRVEASAKVLRDAILCLYHDRALCERLGGWARIHAANEFSLESSFHSMFLNWRTLGLIDQWEIPHKVGFATSPIGAYPLRVAAIWRKVRNFFKFRRVTQMSKKALITGVTGQDGAYLAELLLKKGYEVHGIKRRSSLFNTDRIDHLYQDPHVSGRNFVLHYGDMTDSSSLIRIIQQVQPDEIYNLAAQSHVAVSFEEPEYTANSDALGALRILEAIRILGLEKKTRFYQASTSELYGLVQEIPQKETTPFYPRSPYAVAKLYAYWITVNYREAYGIYACNGILFNHESPMRGETFVTRKITRALARIKLGLQDCLYLGNLDSLRDWGHAKDYVEMQWLMLQQDHPEDFVIATGVQYSVRDFVNAAAEELGIKVRWEGSGVDEKGYDASGKCIVAVDPRYFRPTEVETLLGDPTKAKEKLGWTPQVTFKELVAEMVREDLKSAERDELVKKHGYSAFDYHE